MRVILSVIKGNISILWEMFPAIQHCAHGRSRANQLPIHTMLCDTYKISQSPSEKWEPCIGHTSRAHLCYPEGQALHCSRAVTAKSSRLTKKQSADPSSHPFLPTDHISYLGGHGKICCLRSLPCSLTCLRTTHTGTASSPGLLEFRDLLEIIPISNHRQVIQRHTVVLTIVSIAKT